MNDKIFNADGKKLGSFIPDEAGFEINTLNLPATWDYIYQNRDVLLKVDQFGPVYAQAYPPGDIMLFKRDGRFSPWTVWFKSPKFDAPFNNFFRPLTDTRNPSLEPDNVKITFKPECATYSFDHEGLTICTEYMIPRHGTEIIMKCRIKNNQADAIDIEAFPFLVPYVNAASMAAWDKYEWYLITGCGKDGQNVFWNQLTDSGSNAANRRTALLWTDSENMQGAEISLEKFYGNGSIEAPQGIMDGKLRLNPNDITEKFGEYGENNRLAALPPVYAQHYTYNLKPGEEKVLTQVLAMPPLNSDGWLPDAKVAKASQKYFNESDCIALKKEVKAFYDNMCSRNRISTGDDFFDYYINYWIPLQMDWVASLDRGWPTGMRGSRDCSQDYTALLFNGLHTDCRDVLKTMLSCQRRDGWLPRQFSAKGRHGTHDLRTHVDGGAFMLEFFWMYFAQTGDYALLDEKLPWLDCDDENTVFEHAIAALEYYLAVENIGEHGLCKIRGGDWLDAVNRAGVNGRGESVLVSEQTIINLGYMVDLFKKTGKYAEKIDEYTKLAADFKERIIKAALNDKGYFNGTFTDNGEWIFSDKDPDGEERPYGPSNWYAIISGVVTGDEAKNVLRIADRLKGPHGYRLYVPPMGAKPIPNVGRAASGDSAAYQGENGNVYNHGSQGFLARAMATAGDGDALLDCLKYIMPFDQEKHPTHVAMAAPYGIANTWQELPVFPGRVLFTFLTGSVAMAQRGVYEWMLGIKPTLGGLMIDPCLPSSVTTAKVDFELHGKAFTLEISGANEMLFNGVSVPSAGTHPVTGRKIFAIGADDFKDKNEIIMS